MKSSNFLDDLQANWQKQMSEDFQSQNSELLDVAFEIDGKKLYAHKHRLSITSPTFKSMISERWNSKNESIMIKDYSYEHFKELLSFIYFGECNITDTNIFSMIDMAEFYQINHFKELCGEYLSKIEIDTSNVFQLLDISSKYSLTQMKEILKDYIPKNYTKIVESIEFLKAGKCVIESFLALMTDIILPEELFQAIYQWAENQAKRKQSTEVNLNLNDAIKAEITPFLSFIKFDKMKLSFLNTFVVKRGFIFSYDELSDILNAATPQAKVMLTNSFGELLLGNLSWCDHMETIKLIISLKNIDSAKTYRNNIFWATTCNAPSSRNSLKKRDGVEWYLIYFFDGDIGVRHSSLIDENDYLLAEMAPENGEFEFTTECRIEIV